MKQRSLLLLTLLTLLLATGCAVPSDSAPRDIPPDNVEYDLLGTSTTVSPTGTPEATVNATVYLVTANGLLAPVQRRVTEPLTLGIALGTLIQGATSEEQANGMRSAINQQTAVLGAEVADGVAMIDVSDAFSGVGASEQILALAQLVYTATEASPVTGVQVLLNSAAVEVPRGDGTLTSAPLTRADYLALTATG